MKNLKFILLALCAVLSFGACSKKNNFSLDLSATGLYFQWGGEPQVVTYNAVNTATVELKTVTEGWTCVVDHKSRTITITPPKDPGTEAERETLRDAEVTLEVTSVKGAISKYTIECYIISDSIVHINPNGTYANSYVLTAPRTAYHLDVSHNGGGVAIANIADVKILWQSESSMIQHLLYDEKAQIVSFYLDAKKETNEDDEEVYVKENDEYILPNANAVIAVVDGSENILWSWHLWITKASNNPLNDYSTYANGVTFMNRNLGAFANSNGEADANKILDSYGLYYQWGRKDPFFRPYYHDCSGNEDQYVYGSTNSAVYVEYAEVTSETGTVEYTIAHPLTFITNPACVDDEDGDGIGDWMHAADNTLWSSTKKSAYDPCPYGWRVPAATDFDVLSLTAEEDAMDIDQARKRFGWTLSDGTNSYFYLAAGFRSYYDGTIHNMNYKEGVYPSHPEPWEGYYWTAGITADGKQSTCMYFDLTTTRAINKFNLSYPSKRANAMQIRCVKVK